MLIALSIIVSAVYVLHRELSALRLADITLQIKAIPSAQLLWSLLFCAASYLVLINYDRLA